MKIYDVTKYGAIGDSKTDNAQILQNVINECSNNGGGIVYFPGNNIFMSGPFDLKSNAKIYVESNSILLANPNESVYKKSAFRENLGEGTIWIGGENLQNVSIDGLGTIDGNGIKFMGTEEKAAYVLKEFDIIDPRPHLLTLVNVKNLSIRNITFKNSAYWCLHLVGCDNVKIDGISILNNLKIRNSDGIDLDHSKNVTISNCYIESADDCICFKTRREYEEFGPTENVVVTNCILTSTSCSIKLGSENMDAIRNVIVSNCIIKNSNRGIGIQNRDEGIIENIIFENIIIESRLFDDVWWGKAEPIYVTAYKRKSINHKDSNWRFAKDQTIGNVGKVTDIKFSNINCKSENGIFVGGEEGKIKNVKFYNIQLEINKTTKYKSGIFDLRPSDTVDLLETNISGFHLDSASNVTLNNCSIIWGKNIDPSYKNTAFYKNIEVLAIENFKGHSAQENIEPFVFDNCSQVTIK